MYSETIVSAKKSVFYKSPTRAINNSTQNLELRGFNLMALEHRNVFKNFA